jgi:hypothetical protein
MAASDPPSDETGSARPHSELATRKSALVIRDSQQLSAKLHRKLIGKLLGKLARKLLQELL